MALTITKQTNGAFLLTPSSGEARGSSEPKYDFIGDYITFYDHKGYVMEGNVHYSAITIDAVTDFASAIAVADKLHELGMFPTYV